MGEMYQKYVSEVIATARSQSKPVVVACRPHASRRGHPSVPRRFQHSVSIIAEVLASKIMANIARIEETVPIAICDVRAASKFPMVESCSIATLVCML